MQAKASSVFRNSWEWSPSNYASQVTVTVILNNHLPFVDDINCLASRAHPSPYHSPLPFQQTWPSCSVFVCFCDASKSAFSLWKENVAALLPAFSFYHEPISIAPEDPACD
jgi:hypothetical protein